MNNQPKFDHFDYECFLAEIQEVQGTLLAATTDLTNPLGDLVRAQIRRSQPPVCGAVVLTVSKPQDTALDTGDLRRKRIVLAAALEMLHIALNVHRLLVNAARREQQDAEAGGDGSLDRAFIGSTILAGDYCFSRAAQLAAQTDSPRVVATFSLALQTVSEELLREQFHPENGSGSYDEVRQLLESGAMAAAQLIELNRKDEQANIALSQELATYWARHARGLPAGESPLLGQHTSPLPENWQALHRWLNIQRANGELSPAVYTQPR